MSTGKAQSVVRLLQGCNSLRRLRQIHAQVVVNGLSADPTVSSALIHFCAISVSGSLSYALLLFRCMPQHPPTPAWNSLIRAFAFSSSPLSALLFYNRMLHHPFSRPDAFSFSFALKASERLPSPSKCLELHASLIRTGLSTHVLVCTSLLRCYAANGSVELATAVFEEMPHRDLVSWNAMISCYSQAGLHHRALDMRSRMAAENAGMDAFTLVALLSSCAHLGALNMGVHLHAIARQRRLETSVYVGNALIDVYAKCGSLSEALGVFNRMPKRDIFTWNSIIVGYGVHGQGYDALSFFKQMLLAGMQPNAITFLGLLSGCSHQGLVDEAVEHFHMMSSSFGLKPGAKHYGCMVDLFGRSGKLDKALEVIYGSSLEDPVLWRILLSSSKIHKNVEMGELAMEKLVHLGAYDAGDCVLMASIYSEANNAQGFARMRKMIRSQGTRTTPGWSWIEIDDKVHRFTVDDKSHPESGQIYQKLGEVIDKAKTAGYMPEEALLKVPGSEERFGSVHTYHSEKLAIAFGLARTPNETKLLIVKNLRACKDCHSFTKYVSKAYNRNIIVRDRVRFHHFAGGLCSCGDYW